jgi:hypothetical protein
MVGNSSTASGNANKKRKIELAFPKLEANEDNGEYITRVGMKFR